jgi:hypothetical protein
MARSLRCLFVGFARRFSGTRLSKDKPRPVKGGRNSRGSAASQIASAAWRFPLEHATVPAAGLDFYLFEGDYRRQNRAKMEGCGAVCGLSQPLCATLAQRISNSPPYMRECV